MSMQSVDTHEITPVFGNTKLQQSSNDAGESETSVTSSEPVVNGQNITTDKTSGNTGTDVAESVQETTTTSNTTEAHVNGKTEGTPATVDVNPPIQSASNDNDNPAQESSSTTEATDSVERSIEQESTPATSTEQKDNATTAPTESEPALSISADEVKADVSSTTATNVDNAPMEVSAPSEATTSTAAPTSTTEEPAQTDSATPDRKTRTPRGKAKVPAVVTPPTRQSTRAKKSIAPTNEDENETKEDITTSAPTTAQKTPTSTRGKRQTATTPKDTTPTTTRAGSNTTEVKSETKPDNVRSEDTKEEEDSKAGTRKSKTPTPRKGASATKKREASASPPPPSASKKQKATPKGRKSTGKNDEQPMETDNQKGDEAVTKITTAATNETETVQTPPKKARTSANRKTPTQKTPESSEEYLRKLRPRK